MSVKTYKKHLKPALLFCVLPAVLLYAALCMGAHPVFSLVSLFVRL